MSFTSTHIADLTDLYNPKFSPFPNQARLYSEDDRRYFFDYLDCSFEITETGLTAQERLALRDGDQAVAEQIRAGKLQPIEILFSGAARAVGRVNMFASKTKSAFVCNDEYVNLIKIARAKSKEGIDVLSVTFGQIAKPYSREKVGMLTSLVMKKEWFTPGEEAKIKGALSDLAQALAKAAATRALGR